MKKFISIIICYLCITVLSACSNSMKSSSSHKYQDLGRSCGVSGCWNDAAPGKMHCSEHIAEMNGEIDLCKYNGCTFEAKRDGYCLTHKATKANEGYQTCVKEGCMKKAEKGSIYCAMHSY